MQKPSTLAGGTFSGGTFGGYTFHVPVEDIPPIIKPHRHLTVESFRIPRFVELEPPFKQ